MIIALAASSTVIFDDADFSGSVCGESEIRASNVRASILNASLLGTVSVVETVTGEASLTFLFSIATMVTFMLVGLSLRSARYFPILYSAARRHFIPYSKDRVIAFALPTLGFADA